MVVFVFLANTRNQVRIFTAGIRDITSEEKLSHTNLPPVIRGISYRIFGSGALFGKMFLLRIIENNKN